MRARVPKAENAWSTASRLREQATRLGQDGCSRLQDQGLCLAWAEVVVSPLLVSAAYQARPPDGHRFFSEQGP